MWAQAKHSGSSSSHTSLNSSSLCRLWSLLQLVSVFPRLLILL